VWARPDGPVEAFGWRDTGGSLNTLIAPEFRATGVFDELIDWHVQASSGTDTRAEISLPDADVAAAVRLTDRGFARFDDHLYEGLYRPLDDVSDLVPSAIEVRGVDAGDLPARVAVHRSAFHPSRVTQASYATVMASPLYRAELDVVAVAPEGSFGAFALGWFDPEIEAVELEPVGADPAHRGRGYARAACAQVLRRAHEAGAREAVVWSVVGNEPAGRLYRSLGFRPVSLDAPWRLATAR
jgi:GNAT superfamily N-acetyltransferase